MPGEPERSGSAGSPGDPEGPGNPGRPGHLFLIGFRAAGKSTVGRALASALGAPFVDLDQRVADAGGLPAGELFQREGERRFRAREEAALRALSTAPRAVIATGGGVIEWAASRRLLQSCGWCLWLDPPLDVIRRRMLADPHRPPLRGGSAILEIDELMRHRRPIYEALASLRIVPLDDEAAAVPPAAGEELRGSVLAGFPLEEVRRRFSE